MRQSPTTQGCDTVRELHTRVVRLLACLPNLTDPARWQPVFHDPYYLLTVNGPVLRFTWRATPFDTFVWDIGNCFRTRRDADRARAALHDVVAHLKPYVTP